MGGKSSQDKGKRAERAIVKLLQPVIAAAYKEAAERLEGVTLEVPVLQRNTLQSDRGGYDIVGLEWMALEVKHHEQLSVGSWWKQCVRQCGVGQEPVLVYKQNRVAWRVRMRGWVGEVTACPWPGVVEVDMETLQWYVFHRVVSELLRTGGDAGTAG